VEKKWGGGGAGKEGGVVGGGEVSRGKGKTGMRGRGMVGR